MEVLLSKNKSSSFSLKKKLLIVYMYVLGIFYDHSEKRLVSTRILTLVTSGTVMGVRDGCSHSLLYILFKEEK